MGTISGNKMMVEYAKRLGVSEKETLNKADELYRRFNLKNASNIQENSKIVFCLQSASNLMGTPFEHSDVAHSLSGLKKTEYQRQRQNFEKLLNLTKQLEVSDICSKYELPDTIRTLAVQILKKYEKYAQNKDDVRASQSIAMAVFQSCKIKKKKLSKIKSSLIATSTLDNAKWKRLEEQWDKWMLNEKDLFEDKTIAAVSKKIVAGAEPDDHNQPVPSRESEKSKVIEVTYEDWRDNMLEKAKEELNKLQHHK